jgi:hypothetical protein
VERKTDGQAERASTGWAARVWAGLVWIVQVLSIITIYLLLALLALLLLVPKYRRRRQPCSHMKAAFHLASSTLAHALLK